MMRKRLLFICLMVVVIGAAVFCGCSRQKTTHSAKPQKKVSSSQKAAKIVKTLTLDEKIEQLLLVRYPDNADTVTKQHSFGGYLLFEKDFAGKDTAQVQTMIRQAQANAKIPLLIAVDEEGGAVNRVSTNSKLVESPFKSSQVLYREDGLDAIRADTINKSNILSNLGINLNLAPVVDVCENASDYMYSRSLGQNTQITSQYAKTVIQTSRKTAVSYVLKHFPGYGNNRDTHIGASQDNRSFEYIKTHDLPPFQSGINAGAEAVLISHNIVTSIDPNNPASLSKKVHQCLRHDLHFKGIIMTDAIDMGAVSSMAETSVRAIEAGNDLIITTDYQKSIDEIKRAVAEKRISEATINRLATKILTWKYEKGLIRE